MPRVSSALPTLGELSTIAAETNPADPAFADDLGNAVTWSEFEERSRIAANALLEYVRQGDRVAFFCESSVTHTILWNGALKAGATISSAHTKASPATVRWTIDELHPKILVIDEQYAEFVADHVIDQLESDPVVLVIGDATREYERSYESFVRDVPATRPDILIAEDDIAVIAWTSGTTGRPKGWCHTHRSLALKGLGMDSTFDRTNTQMSSASPSFLAWYGGFLPVLLSGGSMVFLRDWTPEGWAELVEEHEVTHAGMVPTMWRSVLGLDREAYDLSSLKMIRFTGEKIDRTTLERLRDEICPNVRNAYASTEVMVSQMTIKEMDGDRIGSVGKPSNGTRVRIIEPNGDPDDVREPGEIGEIIVNAPDSPVWAWRQTAKTEDVFTDGWWYSGDMGYVDDAGYLYLQGRKDFMIKSKGMKVFPAPIEEHLNEHLGVEQAVIVGIDDDEYGQKVTAAIRREDPDLTANDLDEWCLESDTVARFERPREYIFIDFEVPRTSSQKLDRSSLKERLAHLDGS